MNLEQGVVSTGWIIREILRATGSLAIELALADGVTAMAGRMESTYLILFMSSSNTPIGTMFNGDDTDVFFDEVGDELPPADGTKRSLLTRRFLEEATRQLEAICRYQSAVRGNKRI